MARGTTLVKLLDDYRAEARLSLNPANNSQVRDTQVKLLQRVQETLWTDYNWPHLRVERQYKAQAGQRLYDWQNDFDIDRIQDVYFKHGGDWLKMYAGIDQEHYALHDSDLDARSYPVSRWKIYEGEQIEVWPIADRDGDATTLEGYFKVIGIRRLSPLVADTDRADIDDKLITLFAAAETLGASGAKDASRKLALAERRLMKLMGQLTPRRRFSMFGIGDKPLPRRAVITNYRAPGT